MIPILAAVTAAFLLSACSSRSPQVRSYSLGEKAEFEHIIYTVSETQWMPQFGDGPAARVPQHRFFLVRMAAVNSGGANLIVPNVTIEDDKGNSYPELRNGDGVPQWIGYLRQVKPAESAQGNLCSTPRRPTISCASPTRTGPHGLHRYSAVVRRECRPLKCPPGREEAVTSLALLPRQGLRI